MTTITTTTASPLPLLHTTGGAGSPNNLWVAHPLQLRAAEAATVKMDLLRPILTEEKLTSSALAQIPEDQVQSPVLKRMDKIYRDSTANYKNLLVAAETGELREIAKLDGVKILENTGFFAWLWGKVTGAQFMHEADFLRDTQSQRFAWIHQICSLEQVRLQKVKEELRGAIQPLVKDLLVLEKVNQTSVPKQDQLWQIKKVYEVLFPSEELAEQKDIARLLPDDATMQKKFAALTVIK